MKPWLWLPSKLSHDVSPLFLKTYGLLSGPKTFTWDPFDWKGLRFDNRLGISGGVDKSASCVKGWWALGTGFIEVGTVTPKAQPGHSGYVMDRNLEQSALWNKMGFPSKGIASVKKNLKRVSQPYHAPLFVNIGKNKSTPNQQAHLDYIECINQLYSFADAFVVNISSPNTEGLRELLKPQNLKVFLEPIIKANIKNGKRTHTQEPKPLLLKISPDILDEEFEPILNTSVELGIDGWVLTNTSATIRTGLGFPDDGGVSGAPLANRSKEVLKKALETLGEKRAGKLVISSGGIMTPADVKERIEMGADLVQVYSALVFHGPHFFKNTADFVRLG